MGMLKLWLTVVAFCVAFTLSGCGKEEPSEAEMMGRTYVEGVFSNDITKVLSTIDVSVVTPEQLEEVKIQLQAALDIVAEEIAAQGGFKSYQVTHKSETNKEALLTVVATFKNGTTKETMIALAKSQDKWFVVSM